MADVYRVGTGRSDITPGGPVALGGYGARTGVSTGVDMPLHCTAFSFSDGTTTVCAVSCDLLFITADLMSAARRAVAAHTALDPDALFVTATHTHSAPAGLTDAYDAEYVALVGQRIADAVAESLASAEPAVVRYAEAGLSGVGKNRRDPDGPVETVMRVIVADRPSGGRPVAILMNYACHATVLEADNLKVSADFPGAAAALVECVTGARSAYFQGCAGSINPVWTEHSPREASRVGQVVGAAALGAALASRRPESPRRSVNLSLRRDVTVGPRAGDGTALTGPIWYAHATTELPPRPIRSDAELGDAMRSIGISDASAPAALARYATLEAESVLNRPDFQFWPKVSPSAGGGRPVDTVAVGGFGFGDSFAAVGLPGEPFLQTAVQLRGASRAEHLAVFGYTNGMVGYLPTRDEFPACGYEVGMTRYEPGAAEALADAALRVLGAARRTAP